MENFLIYGLGMPAGGSGAGGNPIVAFLPLILMFGIFYFLLIRPQQQKQKKHQAMVNALKKGDKVITAGGVHGIVATVKEDIISVKVDDNVKLDISKSAITAVDTK